MVNLLFITNSPKIDAVLLALQPCLKVRIDIVADFDFGLKDVFEKRPATVFIQDHIAGVTGESVARHIQMLLGSGAPSFIFMHEGSSKAKLIKGLFEYLIDLSQADSKIVADIQATLKSLLGTQWEKIYIPSKTGLPASKDVVAVPEESRVFADQLVDDFLSDLDVLGVGSVSKIFPMNDYSEPVSPLDELFQVVSSPHDQLAEMLSETNRVTAATKPSAVAAKELHKNASPVSEQMQVLTQHTIKPVVSKQLEVIVSGAASVVKKEPLSPREILPVPPVSSVSTEALVPPASTSGPDDRVIHASSPADFIIVKEGPVEKVAPEELLRVFEGNFSSYSHDWKRYVSIAVIILLCVGGGVWYLLAKQPHHQINSSKPPLIIAPAILPRELVNAGFQAESTVTKKATVSALPAFIPQAGLDSSFPAQKPGWERYIDTTLEFRLYRPAGKILALQVLGLNNHEITESQLKSVLFELTGYGEYRVKLREQKHGYQVSQASVGQKAELLVYRKKTAIRAFVVSME